MDYYDGLEAAEYAEMAADEAADTIAALRAEVTALRLERDAAASMLLLVQQDCVALRVALKFYADENSYEMRVRTSQIDADRGKAARAALDREGRKG